MVKGGEKSDLLLTIVRGGEKSHRQWKVRKERATMMEELPNNDDSNGGASFGRQQQWRKLRTTTTTTEEATEDSDESCRWQHRGQRKLQRCTLVAKEATVLSLDGGGRCTRKQ